MDVNRLQLRSFALVAVVLALGTVGEGVASTLRVAMSEGRVAALTDEREIFLEAPPERGEGLLGFSRRFCGGSDHARAISQANAGAERLLAGVRYRIPLILLRPEMQLDVVRALFVSDYAASGGWYHQVRNISDYGSESLWHVARWFTGRGDNYRAIREANKLADDDLAPGRVILVPARLLRPALRSALPPESPFYVEYAADKAGEYATYRLKPGEALYSSVVIRFTGRIYADDVNALAAEIAERSGIRDVREIPVGYTVKIPFDLLLPEFLPASDPRRREYEAGLLASARYSNPVTAERLRGITVILDAGHGGSDVGASADGVWESVYVYDIMVRVKRLLERTTAAQVLATVRDGREFGLLDEDVLPHSRGHQILTTPSYAISDSTVGLHLRWYLANSYFRQSLKRQGDADKIVFLSIHADSLHPSLRGTMAYIPGAKYRSGTYSKTGAVYAARREVKENPGVAFSYAERVKSEGLSRELAETLVRSFEAGDLAVHPDKPVREKVIRKRKEWVPAVLRYNAVPAQVLLEVCNLANTEDRRLIQTRAFRQQVAERIVHGIVDYYGHSSGGEKMQVALTGR
ncbi:MAG: N-acetylmuramoyl-L-alanine amidase [Acidobacteriota bacterium]|nr:N-acetylmuramoyl-L-alanine amidase [Acidobacteriota bacterium]